MLRVPETLELHSLDPQFKVSALEFHGLDMWAAAGQCLGW